MQDEMNDIQYTKPEDPDIVKVVRCKNCKYWDARDERNVAPCNYYSSDIWTHYRKRDEYCSVGVRRDG